MTTAAKMRVEETTPENVRQVAERMRDSDFREFSAVSYAKTRTQLADTMVQIYGEHPGGMCAYLGDEPVAVGAMIEGRPNVITLMFFATEKMAKIAVPLTRFIRNNVFERYREEGVHRIECISIDGYEAAHRWIEILGLKREATFEGYGKRGEKFVQFAWVKP
jgi:hypothetical protein